MRLKGKRALVTAAGQGIGRATALAFAAEGATVFATDVNEAALATLEGCETFTLDAELKGKYGNFVVRANPPINATVVRARKIDGQLVVDETPRQTGVIPWL